VTERPTTRWVLSLRHHWQEMRASFWFLPRSDCGGRSRNGRSCYRRGRDRRIEVCRPMAAPDPRSRKKKSASGRTRDQNAMNSRYTAFDKPTWQLSCFTAHMTRRTENGGYSKCHSRSRYHIVRAISGMIFAPPLVFGGSRCHRGDIADRCWYDSVENRRQ